MQKIKMVSIQFKYVCYIWICQKGNHIFYELPSYLQTKKDSVRSSAFSNYEIPNSKSAQNKPQNLY